DLRHDFLTAKEALHRVPNKGFGYNVLRFIDSGKADGTGSPRDQEEGLDRELTARIGFNYLGDMGVDKTDGVRLFTDTDIPVGEDISPLNCYGPDIAINCFVRGGSFRLFMDYNKDLYGEDEARRFADGILSQIREITNYLSSDIAPAVTATDLGETQWSEAEFEAVMADFASRGETLERIYPLLPMQEGMLLNAVSEPESYAYRLVDVFEVDGNPTEEMLRRALDRLGRKHEVLRTAIIHEGVTVPRQAIVDRKPGLRMIDLSTDAKAEEAGSKEADAGEAGSKEADVMEAVMKIREEILRDGFDLQRKPLFSVTCVKAPEGRSYLLTAVHHIIVDGWCTGLYMDSLVRYLGEELRNSEMTGDAAKASPDTGNNDAGRYEAAVREILKKDMYAGLAYWEELLDGYETRAAVPSYGIVPEALRSKEDEAYISISPEVTARFEQICREAGATISNGVELAWGMVLGTCSRQDDVVFAKVVSGRDNAGVKTEDVVGLFINSVPVRIRIDQNTTARAALKALQAQTARSNAYDYCPLSEIQKRSYPGSDLLQTVLAFENYNSGREETVSEDILKPVCTREERFDELSLSAYLKDGKLILQASYDTSLYREAEIRQVLALFKTYVEQMSAGPDRRLYTFEHVAAREREEVLALSGGKRLPFDQKQTWLALFLGIADHTPSITAVVDSRGSYTYGELDALSNRIAARLIQMGVGENSFVAIKMDRVKEFIAAVIGVQKAGAAYVPIDPAYPEDRIAYMLEDSGASVTLDEAAVASLMADDSAAKPLNRATPGHRAYMIYTSGSTGKPKGVIIHHHALRAYVAWAARDFGYQAGRHYAHSVTFSFDASVTDIVCPLCVGAQVHVLSDEIRLNPSRLADYLRENQIHGVKFPTQLGMLMLNSYPDLFPEFTVLGGEKLLPVAQTHVLMYNEYGPTEFTIGSSVHLVDQQKDVDIPIGRPVPNTWSLICDAQGRLLPRGMVGELCLAGAQIAEGYLNRPELTAEKFTDCPYLPGEKMYHTGDLARYNEDNELLCLGRIDTQVKLRGFRIELGEIETRASQYPGIQAVAVEVRRDQLVLYYTQAQGREITPEALRPFLAETLADYMVPTAYMPLEAMPMTPNGKIDRKALPEPERRLKEIVAPESPTEEQVLDLAAQMLGEAGFGVTDDLVSLGMSSLLAMRFAATLQSRHDARVRVSDIMKTPTVRGISALIDKASHEQGMALRAFEKRERYPLSENQRGLYIEWEINRNTTQYNIPAVYRFYDANAHALVQAVKAAVEAHPCLKIRLVTENEEVMQQRHDDERVEVTVVTPDH
ncbi:MAG: amino acid adenylation domain-containing protein, partial [Blautia sp.]|nr:amino acid adenylation domain-containing protein [Blautia sp.]